MMELAGKITDLEHSPVETLCSHKAAKIFLVSQLQALREDSAVCTTWNFENKANRNALLAYLIENFFADFDFDAALQDYQVKLKGQRFSSYQFWCVQVKKWENSAQKDSLGLSSALQAYFNLVDLDQINTLADGCGTGDKFFWLAMKNLEALAPSDIDITVLRSMLQKVAKMHLATHVKTYATTKLINTTEEPFDSQEPTTGCPVLFASGKALERFIECNLELARAGAQA